MPSLRSLIPRASSKLPERSWYRYIQVKPLARATVRFRHPFGTCERAVERFRRCVSGLSRNRPSRLSWLTVAVLAALPAPVLAAEDSSVVVGVAVFPPHVMELAESLEGFDIDIWNEVAAELGLDTTFRTVAFEELMQSLRRGEFDVALGGISITREREVYMDFSHPYMNSGLRILTTVDRDIGLVRVFRWLASEAELDALAYLVVFVLLSAHVFYFVERGEADISPQYFPGILEAMWCILATITTVGYGDVTPKRWFGRFVSLLAMVIGISLFGVAIAQLSAGLTIKHLTGDIAGPDDLRGRAVATVEGTTSAQAAVQYGARVQAVRELGQCYSLLHAGTVDAILFDASPLMRYAMQDPTGSVAVVGPLIERQTYGIAFPSGSELREPANRALLLVQESGEYERIFSTWFGDAN